MIKQNQVIKTSTGTLTTIRKEGKDRWICKQESERFEGMVTCLESDLERFQKIY
jgi:hypothetical protein